MKIEVPVKNRRDSTTMEPMTPTRFPVLGPLTRSEEILQFERLRHQLHIVEALRGLRITSPSLPMVSSAVPPTPWRKLREIELSDMVMDKVHNGKVLKCRTVVEPLFFGSLQMLVEDLHDGLKVMNLSIHNYIDQNNITELNVLFAVGREIWIRDPCVKSQEGRAMIIVDDPTNLKLRQTSREIERIMEYGAVDARDWKIKGDVLAKRGRFDEALEAYLNGTYYANANAAILASLLRKRATLLFEIGKPQAARREAMMSLSAKRDDRTLLLLVNILLQLRSYKFALETFHQIVDRDDESQSLLRHLETCVEENQYGKFDTPAIADDANKDDRVTHADFVNASIEVRGGGVGGRGLFALQDLPKGTLLVASKAVCCIYPDEIPRLDTTDEEAGNTLFEVVRSEFIDRIVQLLNSGCQRRILQLTGGPLSFATNIDLRRDDIYDDDISAVNAEIIRPIVAKNSFGGAQRSKVLAMAGDDEKEDRVGGGALYFAPSFFNHSCIPNSTYFTIGDMMFVKTNRDVEKDEELTIHYLYVERPGEKERNETLQRVWGFTCYCDLCLYERSNEDVSETSDKIVENALVFAQDSSVEDAIKRLTSAKRKVYNEYRFHPPHINAIDPAVSPILTPPPPPSLARHLVSLLRELSNLLRKSGKSQELVVPINTELHFMLDLYPHFERIGIAGLPALRVWESQYRNSGSATTVAEWLSQARQTHDLILGEGHFDYQLSRFIDSVKEHTL
jgi:tetratricopeptide (TPR) repeat protein